MAKSRHRVCAVLYSHCLIAINNRVSSSTGASDLLRIPPWMKEAAIVLEVDDDGLLSASSDERTAALAVVARYPSFCLGFFRGFYDFFHDFYCGIHFTNSFSRAPPGTWEINVSTRFRTEKSAQTNN